MGYIKLLYLSSIFTKINFFKIKTKPFASCKNEIINKFKSRTIQQKNNNNINVLTFK